MTLTALGRSGIAPLTNKSGGSVAQGDVVVLGGGAAGAFTTTTTAAFVDGIIGVVLEPNGIANNASGLVCVSGYCPKVNLSSAASLLDLIGTNSVAKQATPHAAPSVAGDFGQVLATGTTPAALLYGQPNPGAGAGVSVATDGIWDAAGDLAVATGSNTAARLPIGTAFQLPRVNSGATALEYAGGMTKLAETVLGSPAASFDFDSIPGTCKHLEVILQARGDTSALQVAVNVRFNNDSAGNYDNQSFGAYHTTLYGGGTSAQTMGLMGQVAAATATANNAGIIRALIPFYAGTTFRKDLTYDDGHKRTDGTVTTYIVDRGMVYWRSTAAITRVTIFPTSGNFVIGSSASLYGIG